MPPETPESTSLPATEPQRPSYSDLFVSFAKVALTGFGGTLPWARRMVVEERRWMTPMEFNEAFSLCQFLPGPNVINFAVVFGSRMRGASGAAVAAAGLIGPPFLLMLAVGALYARYGDIAQLQRVLGGLGAAAAGLLIATATQMALPVVRKGGWRAPLIAVIVFVAVGVLRLPLPWTLAVMAPISIALAWRWRR